MELPLKNMQGVVVGSIELNDTVFDVPFREALVHQVMVGQLANRRVGTHSTKTRAEVRGGGRKPWRQKGTGRARIGSIRAPHWRGGGIAFGPKPRDYHHHTPRKMRQEALRCLLAQKVRDEMVTVVEDLELSVSKTKEAMRMLETLSIRTKCLVVSGDPAPGLGLACRNLHRVKSVPAATINTLDLLDFDHLLMSVGAVRKIEALWARATPESQGADGSAAAAEAPEEEAADA
jgi:large subunit ribosomal protein L4